MKFLQGRREQVAGGCENQNSSVGRREEATATAEGSNIWRGRASCATKMKRHVEGCAQKTQNSEHQFFSVCLSNSALCGFIVACLTHFFFSSSRNEGRVVVSTTLTAPSPSSFGFPSPRVFTVALFRAVLQFFLCTKSCTFSCTGRCWTTLACSRHGTSWWLAARRVLSNPGACIRGRSVALTAFSSSVFGLRRF